MKDTRGRTARDVALRRNNKDILALLEPAKQIRVDAKKIVDKNEIW
jgi:hypothetical protein